MQHSEYWRVALESIGDAVIITDHLGNVTYLNPTAEKLSGWSELDAQGKPAHHVVQVVTKNGIQEVERLAEQVLREKLPSAGKVHGDLRQKDGTQIPVDVSASSIRDEHKRLLGCVLVIRDVSHLRGLSELNERMAAIVESSDDMIVSKTLNGTITSWNQGAEKVLGYRADEVIGQPISMLMPPEAAEDTEKILSKVRRGEKVDHYITQRRHKDGHIVDVSLSVSPIRDADGVIVGAAKVGRDISEVRQAEILRD